MATLTPQFYELLEADQKEIFFKNFTMIPELWPELFQKNNSVRAYEDGMRVAGFGTLALKPEGTPTAFDNPVQGAVVRTVHQTFSLGWRASMEMLMDDQHSIMNQMSADLGESARDHRERLAWSLIDDGFSGTTYTGLQGDTLFESTHVSIRDASLSQTNILSPALDLGQTALEAMMTLAKTTRTDENRFIRLDQAKLCIHPNNAHRAYELLHTEHQVNSNNNNKSTVVASRSGLTPLEVPYKSSTTSWSIHAPVGQNSLTWNDRMDVTFKSAGDAVTGDSQFFVTYRASVMFREWRGNYGSNF
jgi:hypothetical protein